METIIKAIEMDHSSATLMSLDKRLKSVQELIYRRVGKLCLKTCNEMLYHPCTVYQTCETKCQFVQGPSYLSSSPLAWQLILFKKNQTLTK